MICWFFCVFVLFVSALVRFCFSFVIKLTGKLSAGFSALTDFCGEGRDIH